jgi:hypothetical protein
MSGKKFSSGKVLSVNVMPSVVAQKCSPITLSPLTRISSQEAGFRRQDKAWRGEARRAAEEEHV